MAMELEDDVYFADLSKQIALLIMDDEDEDFPVQSPPLHLQGYQLPQTMMPPPYAYNMAYPRESKGTGVFIPFSAVPRRKNKSGKSTSNNNTSSQRQSGAAVSNVANNARLHANQYAKSGALKTRA